MENKMHHLDIIQSVIQRMASNSFALKGWAVTLVAGIFALSSKDADKMYFLIAYVPVLVFWGLDTYYLRQERLYRALYNKVRLQEESQIDFDMNTSLQELQSEKTSYCSCLFSLTELCFYFPLALLSTVIIIITNL